MQFMRRNVIWLLKLITYFVEKRDEIALFLEMKQLTSLCCINLQYIIYLDQNDLFRIFV